MKKVYLIAVVVALIAGFATYLFANQIKESTTIKDAETAQVYVPLQDIAKNTQLTEDMFAEDAGYFTTKTVVTDYVAPNAATAPDQLVGMITADPLYAGEQINTARLESADGADIALSFKLPKGKVAYSISAASLTGADGYITEGDTVDVIIPITDDSGKVASTKVAYKNLYILRVSDANTNTSASANGTPITSYSTLTLEVTEKQAKEIMKIEKNYDYKLLLKPRDASKNPIKRATTTTTQPAG